MIGGYFKVHRKFFDNPVLKPKGPWPYDRAFLWLVAMANFEPARVRFEECIVNVERGQFITSVRKLAETFVWGHGKVERFIQVLKAERMVERQAEHGYSIITICNYNQYQITCDEEVERPGTLTPTTETLILSDENDEKKVFQKKNGTPQKTERQTEHHQSNDLNKELSVFKELSEQETGRGRNVGGTSPSTTKEGSIKNELRINIGRGLGEPKNPDPLPVPPAAPPASSPVIGFPKLVVAETGCELITTGPTEPPKKAPKPKPVFDPTGKTRYLDWVYLSDEQHERVKRYYQQKGLTYEDFQEAVRELDTWFGNNPKMRLKRVDDAKALMGWPLDRALQRKKNLLDTQRAQSFASQNRR